MAHAQILEYENFGENIKKSKPKGGLWIDRKKRTTVQNPGSEPAPHQASKRHHQRPSSYPKSPYNSQQNYNTQNYNTKDAARYKSNTQTAKGDVQSDDLAPLHQQELSNQAPRSRFNSEQSSRFGRNPQEQDRTSQGQTSRFNQRDYQSQNNFHGLQPLTGQVWQDISMAQLEKVMPALKLPLQSFAYQNLLTQVLLSDSSTPVGTTNNAPRFLAMRLNLMYRAGLIGALRFYLKSIPLERRTPLTKFYAIQVGFALGQDQNGLCEDLTDIAVDETALPKAQFQELLLFKAYCAAQSGNIAAAQLSTNLAAEQGVKAKIPFAVIDYLAGMGKPTFTLPAKLSLRDYLFLALSGGRAPSNLLSIAQPALLHYLATNKKSSPEERLHAAEAAALIDLQDSRRLMQAYQNNTQRGSPQSPLRRANMYQSIVTERDKTRQARKMQMLLQNAKQNRLAAPIAKLLHPHLKLIEARNHLDWFAYSAIEIALLAGDYPLAMQWITIGKRDKAGRSGSVANLLILMEISDKSHILPKKAGLLAAEDLAKARYLNANLLHRLVTVLDALNYNIPIPLWESASQTQQPQNGYLPPSGALSALQSAAKTKAPARTILMAIEATGIKGAPDVNLIGLRDIIINLRKAGYEETARHIGFEALYALWPKR